MYTCFCLIKFFRDFFRLSEINGRPNSNNISFIEQYAQLLSFNSEKDHQQQSKSRLTPNSLTLCDILTSHKFQRAHMLVFEAEFKSERLDPSRYFKIGNMTIAVAWRVGAIITFIASILKIAFNFAA